MGVAAPMRAHPPKNTKKKTSFISSDPRKSKGRRYEMNELDRRSSWINLLFPPPDSAKQIQLDTRRQKLVY